MSQNKQSRLHVSHVQLLQLCSELHARRSVDFESLCRHLSFYMPVSSVHSSQMRDSTSLVRGMHQRFERELSCSYHIEIEAAEHVAADLEDD